MGSGQLITRNGNQFNKRTLIELAIITAQILQRSLKPYQVCTQKS